MVGQTKLLANAATQWLILSVPERHVLTKELCAQLGQDFASVVIKIQEELDYLDLEQH